MSTPTNTLTSQAHIPNPHLLTALPDGLNPEQTVDLCNYSAMRAIEHELTMVYSGAFTMAELRERAAHFAACADETAEKRAAADTGPARDPHGGIAAAPTPETVTGVDEEGEAPRRTDDDAVHNPEPEFPAIDPDTGEPANPTAQAIFNALNGALDGNTAPAAPERPPAPGDWDTGEIPVITPEPRDIGDTQLMPAVAE